MDGYLVLGIVLGVLAWIACGFFAYGAAIAFFERQYESLHEYQRQEKPEDRQRGIKNLRFLAWYCFVAGPIGFLIAIICSDRFRYGFQWRIKY